MSNVQANSDKKQSWLSSVDDKGAYVRKSSVFRDHITSDGSSGFKADAGRYHLYVSLACPWAHRTLMVRALKGLEAVMPATVVDWSLGPNGWAFTDKRPKCTLDTVNGCSFLKEVYAKANPEYTGNITVPCIWDKVNQTLVNNESSEIIRMFNSEFQDFCATPEQKQLDLYPNHLREQIDEINSWIYDDINNGVYKCGFAKSQEAYDAAVVKLFQAMDKVENILARSRYLTGNELTEADVRLFTTLIRFDTVYHTHFKTNKQLLIEYPNMWAYTREIYQMPGVADTVDQEHIMKHYYSSHLHINPTGIVPIGPELDLLEPHGREKIGV